MAEKYTNDKLKEMLRERYDKEILNTMIVLEPDAFARAVIGVSEDHRLIYDYDLIIEGLMEEEGMTDEEAVEWIEYNTLRSLPYMDNPPIIKFDLWE